MSLLTRKNSRESGKSFANGQQINKILAEDEAAHEWYRFVLSYPPHLVRQYLTRFGIGPGQTVLDPFCGAGTTGLVTLRFNRKFLGIELSPEYVDMATRRIEQDAPLFNKVIHA